MRWRLPVIFFLLGLALAPCVAAQPVGLVATLEGDVQVRRAGDEAYSRASLRMEVRLGDRLRTGANGKVRVLFHDESELVLGTDSEIEVTEYLYRHETKERKSLLDLVRGKIRFQVTRFFLERKPDYYLQTPTAVVGVRGTEGVLKVVNPTLAYCLTGNLVVQNPSTGEIRDLEAMMKALVERGLPMGVEAIDPSELAGLEAEFQFGSNKAGEGGPPLPRLQDPSQQKLQELIPRPTPSVPVPERPQPHFHRDTFR